MTLDELDALHAAATAGPWEVLVTPESPFCEWRVVGPHYDDAFSDAGQSPCDDDTRDAIVAIHNAWPAFSARLRAAEADVERLRSEVAEQRTLLRWFLDGDHTHEDDCGARGQHDRDVCRNEASQCHNMCEGPHCTCDATEMRDRARAALGEP